MRGGRITKSVASVSGNKARSRSPFHIVKPLKSRDNKEKETFKKGRTFHSRCVGRSNNNAHAYGGLVYSSALNASSLSYTNFSSRLAFKSEKLAEYAAKQFIEIYADLCFIPKAPDAKETK